MSVIGIDFGTCFSSAAIIENNQFIPLKIDSYDTKLASAVFLENNNEFSIGKTAISNRMRDLSRFKKEFKRDFGTTIPYTIADNSYLPEELCTEVLKYIKLKAEERLGKKINKLIVTHPVNWSDFKKKLLNEASFMAGFTEVRLLDEPTAAAIEYSSKESINIGSKILVYDLGGGTFDLSLIEKTQESFREITQSKGLEFCGGIDFDKKILQNIIKFLQKNESVKSLLDKNDVNTKKFLSVLESQVIDLKHALSEHDESLISIPLGYEFVEYHLTKEKFELLIKEDIYKTCCLINDIVRDANLNYEDIDRIILVGGSTRIPYVYEMIQETVENKINIYKDIDPDFAICYGAIRKASITYQSEKELFYKQVDLLEENEKLNIVNLFMDNYSSILKKIDKIKE